MANITEQTTMAELEHELALLGSPTLTVTGRRVNDRGACVHHREHGFTYGQGRTVAQAIDAGLTQLRERLGRSLASARTR